MVVVVVVVVVIIICYCCCKNGKKRFEGAKTYTPWCSIRNGNLLGWPEHCASGGPISVFFLFFFRNIIFTIFLGKKKKKILRPHDWPQFQTPAGYLTNFFQRVLQGDMVICGPL